MKDETSSGLRSTANERRFSKYFSTFYVLYYPKRNYSSLKRKIIYQDSYEWRKISNLSKCLFMFQADVFTISLPRHHFSCLLITACQNWLIGRKNAEIVLGSLITLNKTILNVKKFEFYSAQNII